MYSGMTGFCCDGGGSFLMRLKAVDYWKGRANIDTSLQTDLGELLLVV
jgi:hypothetical protein